jgi:L-seryl-tRNA(Ser) seleniumtransferase
VTSEDAASLYALVGTRPVINAAGAYTLLGGSTLSPRVRAAMDAANRYYADMKDLLEAAGRAIAPHFGAEAAYVTSGAAGALALAAAACMTGNDVEKIERLPDPAGMKDQILIQRALRSRYDRCVTVTGARLVEIGEAEMTREADLEAAIGPDTLAVHYLAPGRPGALPLERVLAIAHARGVPVIVDAAGQTYPLDNLKRFARMGADLVCYAGKYFDAPHSTGVLCGRRDLVQAAALNGFIGFERDGVRSIGRPMKLDRQEIVAVVLALEEWLTMNHEERFLRYGARADVILRAVAGVPGVEAYRISARETPLPVVRDGVRLVFDPAKAPKTAAAVADALRAGDPMVWVYAQGDTLNVSVAFFADGEEAIVAERLRQALLA